MSLHHDLGYFLLACCWPFCMLSTTMQTPWGAHAKTESLLFPSHSSATRIQPQSLADFMDVHCLTYPPCWIYPLLFLLPPSLPSSFFLPAIFCPTWLHARPASPWLLTSKRHLIHQSVTRKRGPFSSALKEREATRVEFIKKEKGQVYEKRTWERKRIRSWPQGTLSHKCKKGGCSCGYTLVELLSCFFCPLRCVQIPPSWSLSHFPCLLAHLSFIPFTWAISTKGGQGLFLPVIHHSTCVFVCVCLFPLSSIFKSHPQNFHHLCAPWHFASPLHFRVAGEPVFRSLGIAIASLPSWSLVHTQLHTHVHSLTDMHRVCVHLCVCEWVLHSVAWPYTWMPHLCRHIRLCQSGCFFSPVLLFFCLRF